MLDIIDTDTTTDDITSWLDERNVDYRVTPEGFILVETDPELGYDELALYLDEQDPGNPGWAWRQALGADSLGSGPLDSADQLAELLGLDDSAELVPIATDGDIDQWREHLRAEERDGRATVLDTRSGARWWPSDEAQTEIDGSSTPMLDAVQMAAEEPMRGRWVD